MTPQLEGLDAELDLTELVLRRPGLPEFPIWQALDAAGTNELERTIEGASTLTVTVSDYSRKLAQTGYLAARCDLTFAGLRWRLVKVEHVADNVALTFEELAVAVLRSYPHAEAERHGFLVQKADGKGSRLRFVRRLVGEVQPELPLKLVTPEDAKPQTISDPAGRPEPGSKQANRGHGFAPGAKVTVKGHPATPQQRDNLARVLEVGVSKGLADPVVVHGRKILVVSMMVVIQESEALTAATNGSHVGLFQQDPRFWPATRKPETDSAAFFDHAIAADRANPSLSYADLAEKVQASGNPGGPAQWRTEAEKLVDLYGVSGDDTADGGQALADNNSATGLDDELDDTSGYFVRGSAVTKGSRKFFVREDNWACLGRLADEINWRRFIVSGALYFTHDRALFASAPRISISEGAPGIDAIDGDYDVGKRNATVTVPCRIGLWTAPPGSVALIEDRGVPFDGRWLVTSVRRNLFSTAGEITLKKPRPRLPEAQAPEHQTSATSTITTRPAKPPKTPSQHEQASLATDAKLLLHAMDNGRYRDDNGQQRTQWEKVSRGEKLTGNILRGAPCSTGPVTLDRRVPLALLMLLDNGFTIGTFAIVEDHHCNNGQHPKGQAVDISSLGKGVVPLTALNHEAPGLRDVLKEAMRLLADFGAWDMIMNGLGVYGQTDIQALQYDNGKPAPGGWWKDHIDHLHFAVAPGARDTA